MISTDKFVFIYFIKDNINKKGSNHEKTRYTYH